LDRWLGTGTLKQQSQETENSENVGASNREMNAVKVHENPS
jgi:hypothetical protein